MPGVNYAQRFFALLALLREETDADNRLDALEIAALFQERTGMVIDPRSVRRTIAEMIEAGMPIDDTHKYFWHGVFSHGEMDYLIGTVQYGYGLSEDQRCMMIDKLLALGDRRVHVETVFPHRVSNPQMLQTLDVIHKAMEANRQVAFQYGRYDIDGQLVPTPSRIRTCKKPRTYNASPYRIVGNNGRFYLIAAVNRHKDLSHYRIDRILNIHMRKALRRSQTEEIRIEDYVLQHCYTYSGPVHRYRLRVERRHLNDVYDWFGRDIICENIDQFYTVIRVLSDKSSMDFWMKRYGEFVKMIETEVAEQGNVDD